MSARRQDEFASVALGFLVATYNAARAVLGAFRRSPKAPAVAP
jgi:hypothetical protein